MRRLPPLYNVVYRSRGASVGKILALAWFSRLKYFRTFSMRKFARPGFQSEWETSVLLLVESQG
jgi:hypothetical protein